MISMQTSVISLMILPSPWLCGGSVVNMSSGARESGKCVKTQLQLVCSNYGSGEFVTTSLLIKRDFLMWINVIYKGKFQSSRRHLLPQHAHSERGQRTPGLQPPDPGPPAASLAHAGGRAPGLRGPLFPSVLRSASCQKWPLQKELVTISTRG